MKLTYGFVIALTLLTGCHATDKHEEQQKPKLSWLQRLRIGTTMHDGKFVSAQNPLHPEHTDHEDHHDQFDTRSHVDHEHPHTHEEEVLLRFFGHQFPDSQGHPNKHNLESCTSLHAETEENLYAIRRLLNSVYSLIEGLEWSNDPKHLSHAHEHHHLLLDNEPWRTTCDDMQHSTVMELKMIETLLRGARKLVGDLEHQWEQPHHFAPELFEPERHDESHHHAEYHYGEYHHGDFHHGEFHHEDFHHGDIHHGDVHHEDSHYDPQHDTHHYGHDSAHHGDHFHHSDGHSDGHDSYYFKKDHH